MITDLNGDVAGIVASQKEIEIEISARSVIIASGSISGNKELVSKFRPELNMDNIKIS